ncbi:MAG TPA: nucleoside-diphosphate kinase [bacterium]|nr:MAG: Nucleoside diphosphate kinase [Parcubacteria group bacterium ADurb.Bin192]HPN14805.1 nucleoside-diphosphate kinase [bacterium]
MTQTCETIQRTLVLLKPDTLERGLVGEIIQRFEKVGLKIVGLKMIWPTEDTALKHYTEDLAIRRGENVRKLMVDMLVSGPVVAVALEGIEIVEQVRKMVGGTEPKTAAPGTIRGDYAHVSYKHADAKNAGIYNLIHASGTPEEAEQEIAVWFDPGELHEFNPNYVQKTII